MNTTITTTANISNRHSRRNLLPVALFILALLLLSSCSKPAIPQTAAELIELGNKYLLELDYEQAIVQFLKAIDIDPKNPQGYIGAAEAYINIGNISAATDILEQGAEAGADTGGEISRKQAELAKEGYAQDPAANKPTAAAGADNADSATPASQPTIAPQQTPTVEQTPSPAPTPEPQGKISRPSATIEVWSTLPLEVKKLPEGTPVTWTSSSENVAEIDETGNVTAKRAGTTEITATADGYTYKCTVTVTDANNGNTVTNGISRETATVEVWSTLTLTIKDLAKGATVKWSTNDKTIATVSGDGKVSAKKAGYVLITAKVSKPEATYTCMVKIVDANSTAVIPTPTPTPTATPKPTVDTSAWKKLYQDLIRESGGVGYENDLDVSYSLYDIDSNGVPELSLNTYLGMGFSSLWTVVDENLVNVVEEMRQSRGSFSILRDGYIEIDSYVQEEEFKRIYKFDGQTLIMVHEYYSDYSVDDDQFYYSVDGGDLLSGNDDDLAELINAMSAQYGGYVDSKYVYLTVEETKVFVLK